MKASKISLAGKSSVDLLGPDSERMIENVAHRINKEKAIKNIVRNSHPKNKYKIGSMKTVTETKYMLRLLVMLV